MDTTLDRGGRLDDGIPAKVHAKVNGSPMNLETDYFLNEDTYRNVFRSFFKVSD